MFTFGRDKERLMAGTFLRYAAAACLVVLAMIIYIYPSIKATSMMYEYSQETAMLRALKERNISLVRTLAERRSLGLIEARAVSDLGMTLPARGQVVIVAKKQ